MLHLLSIHVVILSLLWKQHVLDWTIWTDGCYVSKSSGNENAWMQPLPFPHQKKSPKPNQKCHMYITMFLFPQGNRDCVSDWGSYDLMIGQQFTTAKSYPKAFPSHCRKKIHIFIYLFTCILTPLNWCNMHTKGGTSKKQRPVKQTCVCFLPLVT